MPDSRVQIKMAAVQSGEWKREVEPLIHRRGRDFPPRDGVAAPQKRPLCFIIRYISTSFPREAILHSHNFLLPSRSLPSHAALAHRVRSDVSASRFLSIRGAALFVRARLARGAQSPSFINERQPFCSVGWRRSTQSARGGHQMTNPDK